MKKKRQLTCDAITRPKRTSHFQLFASNFKIFQRRRSAYKSHFISSSMGSRQPHDNVKCKLTCSFYNYLLFIKKPQQQSIEAVVLLLVT